METDQNSEIIEKCNKIQKALEEENLKLACLFKSCVRVEGIKEKLEEINVENLLESYSEFIPFVDEYNTQRIVVNTHMKETWNNLQGDYSTLEKASAFVEKMLKCYNFSYRDCNLHDYVWNKHNSSSKMFKLHNEIVYSNSVNHDDNSALKFVDSLVVSIKKYLPKNMELSWMVKEDEKRCIDWVLIILNETIPEHYLD